MAREVRDADAASTNGDRVVRNFGLRPTEPTEGQLHATVAQFLDWALLPPALYTTFPAGWGVLTRSTAGRLKGCGLKQGMPDILLFHAGRCFGIELKSFWGKVSEAQQEMHDKLRAAGTVVFVCSSLDEVIFALKTIDVPLRRTKGASDERGQTPGRNEEDRQGKLGPH